MGASGCAPMYRYGCGAVRALWAMQPLFPIERICFFIRTSANCRSIQLLTNLPT